MEEGGICSLETKMHEEKLYDPVLLRQLIVAHQVEACCRAARVASREGDA